MSKFKSFLAPAMGAYMSYQKASGRWSNSYESNLRYFDCYCLKLYPNADVLTQEMADGWCAQRLTENNNSCISRIKVVVYFIRYLKERGQTKISEPIFPKKERRTYIPHAFTTTELDNFFKACDSLPSTPPIPTVRSRKITVPVFFRLLYSSGIRTCEARMLLVDDVDLNQGILNIQRSKGESQHFVVLHDTMRDLLIKYNAKIHVMYPGRKYFFPSPYGSHYVRDWVSRNFRELWAVHNTSRATAYELRHHYATENINQWVGEGFMFDSKLLYLSKSMGHSVLESTRYYYSLVPALADIIDNLSGQDFEEIVPEVDDEKSY